MFVSKIISLKIIIMFYVLKLKSAKKILNYFIVYKNTMHFPDEMAFLNIKIFMKDKASWIKFIHGRVKRSKTCYVKHFFKK